MEHEAPGLGRPFLDCGWNEAFPRRRTLVKSKRDIAGSFDDALEIAAPLRLGIAGRSEMIGEDVRGVGAHICNLLDRSDLLVGRRAKRARGDDGGAAIRALGRVTVFQIDASRTKTAIGTGYREMDRETPP